ncbi:hypothetical protein QTG56_23310 (plasmid) [Rossellomorea sp. AcN35-11]|nr:hypothetical protein [Rossellomorea aquimaris]WJV32294.1 hypothetical protein QTG56_23310 [Rossellomorea sp. AcN35-11]
MQSFLFKHRTPFYSGVLLSLIALGLFFTNQPPIHTDKQILIELDKRVEPGVREKPYILVIEWRFPKGSKLYNPKENRMYSLRNSAWSGLNWELKEVDSGIAADQEVGMTAIRYSTAEDLNKAYSILQDPSLWERAIKQSK